MSASVAAAVRKTAARRAGAPLRVVEAIGDTALPYSIEADVTDDDSLLAWAAFRRDWALAGKSARTLAGYAFALAQLARFRGGDLLGCDRDGARAFIGSLVERPGVTDASVASYHRQLRAWFGWAARAEADGGGELLDANPFAFAVRRAAEAASVKRVLTDEQLRALLATCARKAAGAAEFARLRDRAILGILCEAGSPRVAELAALDVDDVDLMTDTLAIRHGKGNKARTIPLSASTAQALGRYLRARRAAEAARVAPAANRHARGGVQNDRWAERGRSAGASATAARHARRTSALWLGGRGAFGVTGIQQMIRDRCARAGIPDTSPHELRHTAYSRWEEAGGLPNDAMALFGWTSDTMTKLYGKSAAARRAADKARRIGLADL